MKVYELIKKLEELPSDYDVVFPPEDYVNLDIYANDLFEQVCIECSPMSRQDLIDEINNGG